MLSRRWAGRWCLFWFEDRGDLAEVVMTLKVVYHSRKCMKILGFLLKGRGGVP